MSFKSVLAKIFSVGAKVGEEVIEASTIIGSVDALENTVIGISRRKTFDNANLAQVLRQIDAIRAGVKAIAK